MSDNFNYDGDSIHTLGDLEALRLNASMYAGSEGLLGIRKLFGEVVENSRDEATIRKQRYEHGDVPDPLLQIDIDMRADGSVLIRDNGRGIPVGLNKKANVPAIYLTFEEMHSGGKLKNDTSSSYSDSVGVHGIGISLVNACSEYVNIKVKSNGLIHELNYTQGGQVRNDLRVIGECDLSDTGTEIEMKYDKEVMSLLDIDSKESDYPYIIAEIERYLEDLVTFSDNLKINFTYDTGEETLEEDKKENKIYQGGLTGSREITREEFSMEKRIQNHSRDYPILSYSKENKEISYKIEMLYNFTDTFCETIKLSAINGLRMTLGSTHQEALEQEVYNFFEIIMRNRKILKDEYDLEHEEVVGRLNYIINLETSRRNFTSQDKSRYADTTITEDLRKDFKLILSELPSEEVERVVSDIEFDYTERVKQAERYKKEQEKRLPRRNKRTSQKALEKFKDCRNGKSLRKKNRVWLLEGDSAGNGFASGRDPNTEAYACFKGKPLNVIKNSIKRARVDSRGRREYVDYEQFVMIREIVEMNKFSKFKICTDADIDGKHIRNLTIFIFYKYFPEVIKRGQLYIVEAPLYQLEKGTGKVRQIKYAYGETDRQELEAQGYILTARYKGLGEVEGNLYDILNTEQKFTQVTMDDIKHPIKSEILDLVGHGEDLTSEEVVNYLGGKDTKVRRLIARDFMSEKLKDYLDEEKKLRKEFISRVNPLYLRDDGVPLTQAELDLIEIEKSHQGIDDIELEM